LTPKCDDLLSSFAFNFNLRRYIEGWLTGKMAASQTSASARVHDDPLVRTLLSEACSAPLKAFLKGWLEN
jgi:hypothetical protein